MNDEKERPVFWMWGQATTVRNPIREAWEARQQARKNPREEARMAYKREHGEWPPEGWEPEVRS